MNKDCMKMKYENLSIIWDRIVEKNMKDCERFLENINNI